MRRELLPPDQRPLAEDVGDVEDGAEEVVALAGDVDVLLHAGEAGVAEVAAVEHGEAVEDEDEGEEAAVEFADDLLLFGGGRGEERAFFLLLAEDGDLFF